MHVLVTFWCLFFDIDPFVILGTELGLQIDRLAKEYLYWEKYSGIYSILSLIK